MYNMEKNCLQDAVKSEYLTVKPYTWGRTIILTPLPVLSIGLTGERKNIKEIWKIWPLRELKAAALTSLKVSSDFLDLCEGLFCFG